MKTTTTKMLTANDILEKRNEARRAGLLAHSANGYGEVMARMNCSCYTCRDILDPTGEEDARTHNMTVIPPTPPLSSIPPLSPAPPPLSFTRIFQTTTVPSLTRSSSHCCSPHAPAPSEDFKRVCCYPSPELLPIPTQCNRQPSESSAGLISPIVGLQTPTSLEVPASPTLTFNFTINLHSIPKSPLSSKMLESNLLPRLEALLETYTAEQLEVEGHYEDPHLKHDEMAVLDMQWNDLDAKINATGKYITLLKKKIE